ncbi:PREDICTED: testis-specific protein 10-interacting protein [Condylura cristata]|uniref:testis-specific protein 10-interacting protein n=1 Tax=Condylura cristata TaxID=143302 RepID=UPI000643DF2D|nr:PREDICTED: testis-specific protein 10-interacting protein [Condylura cristata]
MSDTHQQLLQTSPVGPGQDPQPQAQGATAGLLRLLSGLPQAEQGALRSGDGVLPGQERRAQSAGRTAKGQKPAGQSKKGGEAAEADDLFSPPRKPSFPFQWAWESFTAESRSLPQGPLASHHPGLPLPPAVPQHKPRAKSTAHLPETSGFCGNKDLLSQERRQPLRAWGRDSGQAGRAEGRGPECPREGALRVPRERPGSGPGSRQAPELEAERGLSPRDQHQLPRQGSALEGGRFAEVTEEAEDGEHRDPHRRRARSQIKGWHSGEEAWAEGGPQCPGSDSSSNSPQGQQWRKARAKELEGPRGLEQLQRQFQKHLSCGHEKPPWKALWTPVQASDPSGKAPASADAETSRCADLPNRTFCKRREATRCLLQAWERQEQEQQLQAELRRARVQRVQKQVARCLAAYEPRGGHGPRATQRKVEELRRQERQRAAEYQEELRGIQHRVQARPYLFQQAMQTNARLTVTRHFSQVLSALGLNEEQLLAGTGKGTTEGTSRKPRTAWCRDEITKSDSQ